MTKYIAAVVYVLNDRGRFEVLEDVVTWGTSEEFISTYLELQAAQRFLNKHFEGKGIRGIKAIGVYTDKISANCEAHLGARRELQELNKPWFLKLFS